MKRIDLHTHSNKSDGSLTPSQLVDHAIEKGLSAFALTDHDTVEGLDEALLYSLDKNIEVIPGIELSSEYEGRDIHILGLYIEHHNQAFLKRLEEFRDTRKLRNIKMCRRLADAGIHIPYEDLIAQYPDAVITRAHFAKYMAKHGYVSQPREAFEKYIGDTCKYYVPREKITPAQAVELILSAKGVPVLAHPVLYHMTKSQLDELVSSLKDAGLAGIEAVYSTYKPADERKIRRLAEKYDLAVSGGSDYHGTAKPGLELADGYGGLFIPEDLLQGLKSRKKASHPKIFFADLDGTLLTDDKKITPATKKALGQWLEGGNIFAVSSGRPLESILEVVRQNEIGYCGADNRFHDNLYVVAFNGALACHPASGQKVFEEALPLDIIGRIASIASSHGLYCHTYDDKYILTPTEAPELAFYRRNIHLPYKVLPDFPATVSEPPCKFLFICLELEQPDKLLEAAADIMKEFPDTVTCVKSNAYLLEVFSSRSGKGSAVNKLCRLLSIPVADSYAAGDEQNDISMLQAAGCGIAMCSGSELVKQKADVVTKTGNNEDGLVPFLNA